MATWCIIVPVETARRIREAACLFLSAGLAMAASRSSGIRQVIPKVGTPPVGQVTGRPRCKASCMAVKATHGPALVTNGAAFRLRTPTPCNDNGIEGADTLGETQRGVLTVRAVACTPTACGADQVASITTAGMSSFAAVRQSHRSTPSTLPATKDPSLVHVIFGSGLDTLEVLKARDVTLAFVVAPRIIKAVIVGNATISIKGRIRTNNGGPGYFERLSLSTLPTPFAIRIPFLTLQDGHLRREPLFGLLRTPFTRVLLLITSLKRGVATDSQL